MPSCELITDPARFTQLMFSDHYDGRQFCFISDDVAMVQWCHADGRGSQVKDVNVFVGAMTTAYARLTLYDLLDKLQERILYCDTDSVIFTSHPGQWVPPLGPYLGELTDELNDGGSGEDDHITEFVSGGPKCYAYYTKQGKTQTGRISADVFSKSFLEWSAVKCEVDRMCKEPCFSCPACTPDMLAVSVDGNRKLYRFQSNASTSEQGNFEGVFIEKDEEVAEFVKYIQRHTNDIKWGGAFQDGAGSTVGEEVEQVNSFLSRAAITTKYMSKAGRTDMLSLLALGWNKRKVEQLGRTLSQRYLKIIRILREQVESLNASRNELGVDDDTLQQWAEGESQYNALVYNNRTHHGLINEDFKGLSAGVGNV
uniref:uncharacterized protein LOC112432909 n=1 Tax=Maylandia zebra TaxID=106582 RepID=UPI000D317566|nr:uncharacterized protein LOC112432909 [Maylandia zebra]